MDTPCDLLQYELEYNPILANPFHIRLWLRDEATKDLIIVYGAVTTDVADAIVAVAHSIGYLPNGF